MRGKLTKLIRLSAIVNGFAVVVLGVSGLNWPASGIQREKVLESPPGSSFYPSCRRRNAGTSNVEPRSKSGSIWSFSSLSIAASVSIGSIESAGDRAAASGAGCVAGAAVVEPALGAVAGAAAAAAVAAAGAPLRRTILGPRAIVQRPRARSPAGVLVL